MVSYPGVAGPDLTFINFSKIFDFCNYNYDRELVSKLDLL